MNAVEELKKLVEAAKIEAGKDREQPLCTPGLFGVRRRHRWAAWLEHGRLMSDRNGIVALVQLRSCKRCGDIQTKEVRYGRG